LGPTINSVKYEKLIQEMRHRTWFLRRHLNHFYT